MLTETDVEAAERHTRTVGGERLGRRRQDVEREIAAALGDVPSFFSELPDWRLQPQWESFRWVNLRETTLSRKQRELIAIAVAGALDSEPAVYLHTQVARALGATDEEIAEASLVGESAARFAVVMRARGEHGAGFRAQADAVARALATSLPTAA